MIEQKLREYKSNLSKLKLIECSMKQIESEIQVLEPSYISAYAFSDVPPSKTNKVSSPVENTVLAEENKREKVDRLKADLWELAKDRVTIKCKTDYVEALLTGLTEEERFVIELYYFDGLSEPTIANRYQRQFSTYRNIRTLRRKRFAALRKMERNAAAAKVKNPV